MANEKYPVSEAFHHKYQKLCGHIVKVFLKEGRIIEGGFQDEFFEDEAILISTAGNGIEIFRISEIAYMRLSETG